MKMKIYQLYFFITLTNFSSMRPQYALREFILQTTYPPKELSEDKKTIQEANLQNSAIMQRLK